MSVDLSNEENWIEIFSEERELPEDERATKQNRIPNFITAAIYEHPYFKIYAENKHAEPHWWMAGTVNLMIGSIANETPAIADSLAVPLGRWTLVRFDPLAVAWHLEFQPNYWHRHLALNIEQYQPLN